MVNFIARKLLNGLSFHIKPPSAFAERGAGHGGDSFIPSFIYIYLYHRTKRFIFFLAERGAGYDGEQRGAHVPLATPPHTVGYVGVCVQISAAAGG